jgi:DeoR/GlpR family transcriptional regulator of sugar metabolism
MRQARQKIVVADHRKIGAVGTALISPLSEVNILSTDKGVSAEAIAPFVAMGIEVHRA